MSKLEKGYLTEQGKFFKEKDEADTFEAIAAAKTFTTEISKALGFGSDPTSQQVVVRTLVANADKLAPALRAMSKFVKRNRKDIAEATEALAAATTVNNETTNAIKQLVSKHF